MSPICYHRQRTRRLYWLCAAAALLLSANAPALAQTADTDFTPIDSLARSAEARVREPLPQTAEVHAEALDPRLKLPRCTALTADAPSGRGALVNVALRCSAPQSWTVYVPVRVRDPRPVRVLVAATRRGDPLSDAHFSTETRDVAQLPFGFVAADAPLAELEYRRALAPGQVLAPQDLAPARVVRRGDMVQLVRRVGGLEVRADGKALADAARGERVRVENSGSKRIVEGRASGPGRVEM